MLTVRVSEAEGLRIVAAAYAGKTLHGMLCLNSDATVSVDDPVAAWEAHEIVAAGYARTSAVVGTGSFNTTTREFTPPEITLSFSAGARYYRYSHLVLWLDTSLYPCAVLEEFPEASVLARQTRSYVLAFGAQGVYFAGVRVPLLTVTQQALAPSVET